jgi:Flp pilus assembly protein TadD
VRELYEAWVEFEVIDASGKAIYHSGFLQPDGMLDQSAHVYKQIILDERGRPLTRHQIWLTNIKAYDNTIPPGRSDIARFRFRMPDNADASKPVTLRARVNYRRLNQEYTNYVLNRQKRQLVIPVVRMAEAETKLTAGVMAAMPDKAKAGNGMADSIKTLPWKRWNDYSIGLLGQAQYGPAAEGFRRASILNPSDSNLIANIAIAEMRTEHFGPGREQLRKASVLLESALKLNPANWRTRYFRTLVLRGDGKMAEAAAELQQIVAQYPRDRDVQRSLGQTLFTLGRIAEARNAFESVIAIDPTDFNTWQFLTSVYNSEGRTADSRRAQSLYLTWRDDPLAYDIALRFFAAHPQWGDERIGAHTHGQYSSQRPVVAGLHAAPDR